MLIKKFICLTLSVATVVSAALQITANAESSSEILLEPEVSGVDFVSSSSASDMDFFYNGKNINTQNYIEYTRWATPIDSYLSACPDGRIIRFQNSDEGDCYLAEYFDDKYNLVETKLIPKEMRIFGGFYNAGDSYIIVTGEENYDENNNAEVLRITKYDANWNRHSSSSLYGANTASPFRFGSLRFARSGNYILIRTSHDKYKGDHDINHQANMTVQYDLSSASITDSSTHTANDKEGYISHSLNQFILVENDKIVALDHGDAYPRSIALVKYQTNVSTGKFAPDYFKTPCTIIDAVNIPGSFGDSHTGICIGGFEASDSNYLIGGNIVVDSNDYNDYKAGRNIFVAAVDKKTSKVRMNILTNFSRNDVCLDTPQFVKMGDNRFMALWTQRKSSKVYYVEIDALGRKKSKTYSMSGNLSDCKPEVINGNLVWYVWDGKKVCFNSIDTNDISKHSSKTMDYDVLNNKTYMYGDMDDNEIIDSFDSLCILRASVGLEKFDALHMELADVDLNNRIDSADSLEALRFSVLLPSKTHCGKYKP